MMSEHLNTPTNNTGQNSTGQDSTGQDSTGQEPVVWDYELALKRVRGKPERLRRLVGMFLNEIPERKSQMLSALKDNNLETMAHLAHAMKGITGSLGIVNLGELVAAIETGSRQSDMVCVQALMPDFVTQLHVVENTLTQFHDHGLLPGANIAD